MAVQSISDHLLLLNLSIQTAGVHPVQILYQNQTISSFRLAVRPALADASQSLLIAMQGVDSKDCSCTLPGIDLEDSVNGPTQLYTGCASVPLEARRTCFFKVGKIYDTFVDFRDRFGNKIEQSGLQFLAPQLQLRSLSATANFTAQVQPDISRRAFPATCILTYASYRRTIESFLLFLSFHQKQMRIHTHNYSPVTHEGFAKVLRVPMNFRFVQLKNPPV